MKFYIKASSEQNQDKIKKLYEIQNEMVSFLRENDISDVEPEGVKVYEDIPDIGIIDIYVCGDWKHDLLRARYLITQKYHIIKYESEALEDTGSDWGPELQHYYIYIPEFVD